jgi:hypothetical protein
MTVRCVLDDGSTLEMVNTYVIPGVLFVGQGSAGNSEMVNINTNPLANESADFFIVRAVSGYTGMVIDNGSTSASVYALPGDVFVLPSNNGITVDTNAGATTNPNALSGIQFGTGTGAAANTRVAWMTLNNTAS